MTKQETIATDCLERSTTELKLTCPITDGLKRTPPLSTNSEMEFKRYNFRRVRGYYIQLFGVMYRMEKYQIVPRELQYNIVPHIKIFDWYFYRVNVSYKTLHRMKSIKKCCLRNK